MNYNTITRLKILDSLDIEIEYDGKYKVIYKNVLDFYFNKSINDIYPFDIIDKFTTILKDSDYDFINKAFGIFYDRKYFDDELVGKFSLVKLEGSVTIYLIYKD